MSARLSSPASQTRARIGVKYSVVRRSKNCFRTILRSSSSVIIVLTATSLRWTTPCLEGGCQLSPGEAHAADRQRLCVIPTRDAILSCNLLSSFLQHPDEGIQRAPALDSFVREPAVLVVAVRLTPWGTGGGSAVHAASPVRHRGRAARALAAGLGPA